MTIYIVLVRYYDDRVREDIPAVFKDRNSALVYIKERGYEKTSRIIERELL